MRTLLVISALTIASTTPTLAGDYQCKDGRVEKGSLTKFTIRRSGSDFAIEKNGSTVGNGVKRNGKIAVEVNGSTKGTIDGDKIEKSNGLSWSTVSEAKRTFECDGDVAGTLWVLFQIGALP
jgi:hypothetical protein